jgi:class 3 adenylate cyclase
MTNASEIRAWLAELGLAKYADLFSSNAIDLDVVRELTEADLKDLGVEAMGDRKRLLRAIASLSAAKAPTVVPTATLQSPTDAERRQVTVMFSDLVGSTALAARMDPEDLREVISAYQKCVAEIVRRFDGFVAKYLGDGVLIYFGYPQAHEDDAERAVRAGLELIAAVTGLKTHASLQTRVGIATGLVVVGDLIGSGAAQEQGIVGETPNLAARLQGLAEPNMVVIAESTRRLLGSLFELRDLGARNLKGIVGPVQVWAALRASSVASRFEALRASGLTDLVGREEECEILLRRWSRAKAKARWYCFPASPASANRGSRPHCWNAWRRSRTHGCAISVPHSTPTARFFRLSARCNAPPDWGTTTRRGRGSTSSTLCSRKPRLLSRTPH